MRENQSIRIGNQTAFSAATLREPFEFALAQGFDAFEWFPDKKPSGGGWDESDLTREQRWEIREVAKVRGVRLSVHARWQANPLKPDGAAIIFKDVELAEDLGAVLLNIHLYTEAGLDAYVQQTLPLITRLAATGIKLAIENTVTTGPEDFNELFARYRALPSAPIENVGMCLDVGHANLCDSTRNNYLQYLDRLGPQTPLIHVHLHENWGDMDSHLAIFSGPAGRQDAGVRGLLDRLRKRNYSGSIILEQWPQPRSLLTDARNRLRDLLKEGNREQPRDQGLPPAPPAPSDEKYRQTVQTTAHCSQASTRTAGDDFVDTLVEADQRCRSWREKLDFVHSLFSDGDRELTTEQLVDLAIYLRFLGTGEIPCTEDDRHFRPSHHARLSGQIQQHLAKLTLPENAFVMRKIYPWLPSSGAAFTRAEPLTRIRDIAHRNDIPSDLKREIKHRLQNKLHRCAGPEDLATSTALLELITAPGANYSPAFVEQFRIFHEELKEFFNARSLEDRLQALLPKVATEDAALIRGFLREKAGTGLRSQLAALILLTSLRRRFLAQVKKGLNAETQEFLLADIALEDFAFVLLSAMINQFEAAGRAISWDFLLDTLLLAIFNLVLSGTEPEECRALEAELQNWRHGFNPQDREQLLRLKATVDRCRRLADDYSSRIMALFTQRVETLGRALRVPAHALRTFCEAEIRGHIMFQLSKTVAILLQRMRVDLALPAWDVLVSGRAAGRLCVTTWLADLPANLSEPVVVALEHAEGDEEIPPAVTAIMLAHEIPHLSHFGVRARQHGTVFVACEEAAKFNELRQHQGQQIELEATPEGVKWARASALAASAPKEIPSRPVSLSEVRLQAERACLPLEEIDAAEGGGKATGARRLAELARHNGTMFKTVPTVVVPFGVMEQSLRAAPALGEEYRRLCAQINSFAPQDLVAVTDRLREMIQQLAVPKEITVAVAEHFSPTDRLMVRSSANCEDLDQLAGAGLYESIANVAPADVSDAVRKVWASLWTRRATLSRQQAGIPHEHAQMAVLIQRLLTPDFSFILHTVNPVRLQPREVYAEVAVGLGETLASSAFRGNPYRLICDKRSGGLTMLAFANFSRAIWPQPAGGVASKTVDYSRIALSCDAAARRKLGARLAGIALYVEDALGAPQDIEGVVVGQEIYLVQSRRQQGCLDAKNQ